MIDDNSILLKQKIELDIKVNKRCLQEESSSTVRKLLKLWLKYDEELLEILNEEVNKK